MRRSAPLRLPANSSHPSRGKSHATPAIVTIVTDVDKLYKILPIIRITFINRTAITDSREASRGEEFFFSEKTPPLCVSSNILPDVVTHDADRRRSRLLVAAFELQTKKLIVDVLSHP